MGHIGFLFSVWEDEGTQDPHLLPTRPRRSDETRNGSLGRPARRPGGSVWCLQHKHLEVMTHPHTQMCVCVAGGAWVLRGTAPAKRSGWLLSSLCLSSGCPQLLGPISAMGRFLLAGWWYRAISS